MAKFKIIGPRAVAGVEPGGIVDLADDDGVNVAALIEAGHVAPVETGGKVKAKFALRGEDGPELKAEKEDVD